MQRPGQSELLKLHPNTIDELRRLYGLDKPGDMDNALDILEDWVKQQTHFIKKKFSRPYLEMTLILCKGSIERTKKRLDRRCTYKTMLPKFFGNFDIRNDFSEFHGNIHFTIISKLTENHQRTALIRFNGKNLKPTFTVQMFRLIIMVCEFVLYSADYIAGSIFIVDILEASLSDIISVINIVELQQAETIVVGGYGARIAALHFLSKSRISGILFKIVKQVSEKLSSRVHIHQSKETLHNFFPKDMLPMDYGGTQRTLAEQYEDWLEAVSSEEFRAYMSEMSKAGTDESLRDTTKFNEEYMGMPGTFRFFNVD